MDWTVLSVCEGWRRADNHDMVTTLQYHNNREKPALVSALRWRCGDVEMTDGGGGLVTPPVRHPPPRLVSAGPGVRGSGVGYKYCLPGWEQLVPVPGKYPDQTRLSQPIIKTAHWPQPSHETFPHSLLPHHHILHS